MQDYLPDVRSSGVFRHMKMKPESYIVSIAEKNSVLNMEVEMHKELSEILEFEIYT